MNTAKVVEPLRMVCETSDPHQTTYAYIALTRADAMLLQGRIRVVARLQSADDTLQSMSYNDADVWWLGDIPDPDKAQPGQWTALDLSAPVSPEDEDGPPVPMLPITVPTAVVTAAGVRWEAYHKHGDLPTPFETELLSLTDIETYLKETA